MVTLKGVDPRMIANNLTPYEPTHPGEVLKEEIEYRGVSQRRLAAQMGMSYSVLNEVLNAKRPVTTEYALLFEAALGVEADMWIKMQARYNMQVARKNIKLNKRLAEIRKAAAILL
jgi:addiction module HigA family antidote